MSAQTVELSIALSDNERTRPILQGRIQPQGIRLLPTCVHPSEMFWRQLRFGDFDVSEMSMSSLLIAVSQGDTRWVGIPIYTMRKFFHTGILVRRDANIKTPADLRGKRVGVPEYQQTAAIWSRGILQHEFGVHAREIEWFMERGPDKSHGHATKFAPPDGVKLNQIPSSTNIGEMMVKGELDATLLYIADKNLVDRSRIDLESHPDITTLFADPLAERQRYFAKTGVYPINHAMVMKRSVFEKYPWAPINIFHAFMAAKQDVESETMATLDSYFDAGLLDANARKAVSTDIKAYGLKTAGKVLDMVAGFVHEQGLTNRRVRLDEIFAPSTLDL